MLRAFDRVEWQYLFYVLHQFGFGKQFLHMVRALYACPSACVYTNGISSVSFPLDRGMKQGCLLSPLLFVLALEPLAQKIRASPNIKGIVIDQMEHKLVLYTDDVLLLIKDPKTSVPLLLSMIEPYAAISGYKAELMKNITTAEQPYLFTRHIHFLNFTRFGMEQPVHINIIRDPVSRFLSNYFFRRFGDWRSEQNRMIRTPGMKDEERYLDIDECILDNYPECSNPRLFYVIPFFCGQHPKCREPGLWALERAKQNVNENFLLVGILEELEDVLLILERLLPHYFKDVISIYKSPGNMFLELM
nr:PREDICTED: uronyl 2-sulfotransferase-like [Latimeria chalumnae]|eukprot:XP_014349730.1 PREDICTED: uronyl 2-sulfotransferase-like [Latimeria chalumnae]